MISVKETCARAESGNNTEMKLIKTKLNILFIKKLIKRNRGEIYAVVSLTTLFVLKGDFDF